jgi:hypothetical protein
MHRTAAIRLLAPEAPEPNWCWRDDWLSGGESIYSLLAMFESLNVVCGRQVANAMIQREENFYGKPKVGPIVDLRSSARFDMSRLASATRLSPQVLREAFVTEAFPNSGWSGHINLRWCAQCVKRAFHSTIFQLPFLMSCPAHGDLLRDRCPRCQSLVPYKLVGTYSSKLFHCPRCKHCLCPGLDEVIKKSRLTSDERAAIRSKFDLISFCDRLPMVLVGLLGIGLGKRDDMVLSSSRDFSLDLEFASFVSQVLVSLEPSPQVDWLRVEPSLLFNDLIPLRSRGLLVKTKVSVGWPEHLVPRTDPKLKRATQIYRIIRRHLWRSDMHGHHKCVISACKHIWWPISGSKTGVLCPFAVAYIRWRMAWENLTVPSQLLDRPTKMPLGLATWLAAVAPFGAASYPPVLTSWLVDHILAQELLFSFRTLLMAACRQIALGVIDWSRESFVEQRQTCWVCAGRGTTQSPCRLFIAPPLKKMLSPCESPLVQAIGHTHLRYHLEALKAILH